MRDWIQSWRSFWAGGSWLTLGIGIKRWLLLLGLGAGLAGFGLVSLLQGLYQASLLPASVYVQFMLYDWPVWLRVGLPLLLGLVAILFAIKRLAANLIAPFRPPGRPILESLYDHSRQQRGPHIVAIGGGTGLPNLLRGLTQYTSNITAIVTVADDGGSSGRLRRELGLLPPGDFRNNIAALSRDETLMTQVLQYRFGGRGPEDGDGDLQGHAFGNLLLAALTGITGSFDEALLASERVLAMRGRVLPSTLQSVVLVADISVQDETGQTLQRRVEGESAITRCGGHIENIWLEPAQVRTYPPALRAIFQADLIVIGPGSLYTSILPNLLVPDLAEALAYATAPTIYICNLATQPGETDDYTVAEHVDAIMRHVPPGCLDIVLANNNLSVAPDTGGGHTVFVKLASPKQLRVVAVDLVDESRPWRHDTAKLAAAVMDIARTQRLWN
jgi:uncharacterized cofD-like protein